MGKAVEDPARARLVEEEATDFLRITKSNEYNEAVEQNALPHIYAVTIACDRISQEGPAKSAQVAAVELKLSKTGIMVAKEFIKAGFQPGQGLGCANQGRTAIVTLEGNKDGYGLGKWLKPKRCCRNKRFRPRRSCPNRPLRSQNKLRNMKGDSSVWGFSVLVAFAFYWERDFCYYANTIFLVDLLLYRRNEKLFMICYSFAEGPLAWALIVWRCSLVFSSVDKIITTVAFTLWLDRTESFYTCKSFMLGIVFFTIRWWDPATFAAMHPEGTSRKASWPYVEGKSLDMTFSGSFSCLNPMADSLFSHCQCLALTKAVKRS
uniref:Glycerophosphocholine acyltransferase 1 n=1 Tax=Fagus sylvatica TaxID=28930 RepID=A0A2N9F1G9_FAGSY